MANALWELLKRNPEISYDSDLKKQFKRAGNTFLRSVRSRLFPVLEDYRISYNAGGIAVSGDHSLYAMFKNGNGACVFFNADGLGSFVTFREIKHLKDFQGGANQNMNMAVLSDADLVAQKLKIVARVSQTY